MIEQALSLLDAGTGQSKRRDPGQDAETIDV